MLHIFPVQKKSERSRKIIDTWKKVKFVIVWNFYLKNIDPATWERVSLYRQSRCSTEVCHPWLGYGQNCSRRWPDYVSTVVLQWRNFPAKNWVWNSNSLVLDESRLCLVFSVQSRWQNWERYFRPPVHFNPTFHRLYLQRCRLTSAGIPSNSTFTRQNSCPFIQTSLTSWGLPSFGMRSIGSGPVHRVIFSTSRKCDASTTDLWERGSCCRRVRSHLWSLFPKTLLFEWKK
jgi:hypothetical protein